MVRAHLSPSDDPRRANVDLIAIPVTVDKMKSLPSQEILKGVGYPSILVKEGSRFPTKLAPAVDNETKPFGLPMWPILLMGSEETVFPSAESIVAAVRKVWHEATLPPVVMAADWYRQTHKREGRGFYSGPS